MPFWTKLPMALGGYSCKASVSLATIREWNYNMKARFINGVSKIFNSYGVTTSPTLNNTNYGKHEYQWWRNVIVES
jgi:hypothetical protein